MLLRNKIKKAKEWPLKNRIGPHHHPNQHTKAKDALIRNMRRRRPHDGLVVFWVRLRLCQYTAIDECTRLRYLGAFEKQNPFSSAQFLQQLVDAFPFPIRKVQADGGTEFAKRFTKGSEHDETLFEKQLREYGIEHQKIRPCTPRHNGKVERSRRKDNEEFDASHKFYSFADFKRQLARRNRICNAFPMRPLGWDSPNKCLEKYLAQCNT